MAAPRIAQQLHIEHIERIQDKPQKNQQLRYQHHCYHRHKESNKENVKNCYNTSGDDFYHIKPYYPSSCALNQRISFHYSYYYYNNYKFSTPHTSVTRRTASALSSVLYSISSNGQHTFFKTLLFAYLLLVQYAVAAPQSCILCDKNDLQAKDPQTNYEEFLFEHQVTRQDAINALRQLNESFYEGEN